MSKLSVLMTVYNEADFIKHAIEACLPHVDLLVIVEGAYQETINLGKSARSTDGTLDILKKYESPMMECGCPEGKVVVLQANEQTDKDQRNVGLERIKKEVGTDGWCLIIDGDEVYESETFKMIQVAIKNMEKSNKYGAYFKSLTFVNDAQHYTEQEFPRLFRITPDAKFVNDNFMSWEDKKIAWQYPHIIKIPYINYYHYSFCKGRERFELKKKWWETRFGQAFDYGWRVDEKGKITDDNHDIYEFTGNHPAIMKDHPLLEKKKDET